MSSTAFVLDHAFLPTGWAANVLIEVGEQGLITALKPEAGPCPGVRRLAGATLPGLPNLHSHTFQRGMAGLAERRGPAADSFWSWREVMYGFLGKLTPNDVEAIAALAMVEMLEGGFTSLAEFHYLHHAPDGAPYANRAEMAERIAAAAAMTGMALTLLPVLYSHGGFGGAAAGHGQRRFLNDFEGYLALREGSARALRGLPGAVLGAAPHSLRAVTEEQLTRLAGVAATGPMHIHVGEQVKEVEDCLAWSGQRPVEWLLGHAAVDARWTLIHATHMTAGEVRDVAAAQAVAGLCPITEANLGDGIFEAVDFLQKGGRLGVGSDSNVEITAPGELRLLEYGQRLKHRGRNMLAAREGLSTGEALYRSALAGGAQALGQPAGALEPGKRADLVTLDLAHPAFAGGNPPSWLDAYVFNAGAAAIRDVFVGGRQVVAEGRHIARDHVRRRFASVMNGLA